MVANWFSFFFTYSGNNHALKGLLDAVELVMETGFAVSAFISIFLNLVLPLEIEDDETIDAGEAAESSLHSHEVEDGNKPVPVQSTAEGEKMA
jgi:xanthine/uracil permease